MISRNVVFAALGAAVIVACTGDGTAQDNYNRLRGSVKVDGSSTVYPITEAVAEEFAGVAPAVNVTVAISGTGGGFKRFSVGETDISNASRPIKAAELAQTRENNVEFIELPVAYDGLSVVVNPGNYWAKDLTVEELQQIFLEDQAAKRWSEVRPEWPDTPIKVYAPGTDSGTFDYFKEIVASDGRSIRSDMSVSEDDNVLVRGVAGDENAIGFFGFAYYTENSNKLRVVPIVNPETKKPVTPTRETIESGEYAPFSRPLFIYVNARSLRRPEVRGLVDYYLTDGIELLKEVGYVRLPDSVYDRARENVRQRRTGTHYINDAGETVEGPVTKVYLKD